MDERAKSTPAPIAVGRWLIALVAVSLLGASPAEGAHSPTGRDPTLLWTPSQQAVWNKMLAERHPWTERIKQLGRAPKSYPNRGEWQVMAYQLTGDERYAALAWAKIAPRLSTPVGGFGANDIRENMIEDAVFYDWLLPWMNDARRTAYADYLHRQCEYCLGIGTPKYKGGFRIVDSDQTTGQYFGIIAVDKATGSNYASKIPPDVEPAIRNFLRLAKGGVWVESSEYNPGTVKLLLMGASIAGWDVSEFAAEYGRAESLVFTPDLADVYQWGDDENPHQLRLYNRLATFAMVNANDTVRTLSAKYPTVADQPWWRWPLFHDPAKPGHDDLAPGSLYAEGAGMMLVKTSDALFASHFPRRTQIDHEVPYFGDFQLYFNHEWVVGHPIGYGSPAQAANTMLLAGIGSMAERSPTDHESKAGIHRITGTTSGPLYSLPYYDPPPAFLRNWTRTVIFIEPSTLVIHDKIDMKNPQSLPKLDRYRATDQAAIRANPLQQWLLHTPVSPSISQDQASWRTPKGQRVTLQTLLPTKVTRESINESNLFGATVRPAEKKFHVRLIATAPEWLNVISVGQVPACKVVDRGVEIDGKRIDLSR